MTATAMKTWKTFGILLRNHKIHCKFTVIPSSKKKTKFRQVMSLVVMVCGRHCRTLRTQPLQCYRILTHQSRQEHYHPSVLWDCSLGDTLPNQPGVENGPVNENPSVYAWLSYYYSGWLPTWKTWKSQGNYGLPVVCYHSCDSHKINITVRSKVDMHKMDRIPLVV